MVADIPPPVTFAHWVEQVADDPSIPPEFKNGAENQIKLTGETFSSGSVIKSSEILRMRILWHKFRSIEALGIMMADDPNIDHTGYVSAENYSAARLIFDDKRHLWEPYLEELKLRAAYQKSLSTKDTITAELSEPDGMEYPPRPQPHNPSKECKGFFTAMHWQRLGLTKREHRKPTTDEVESESSISKPGPGAKPTAIASLIAVNQPVTPLRIKDRWPAAQDTPMDGFKGTPETNSYYPGRGGKSNTPAVDESYINTALLLLLQSILHIEVDFGRMQWLPARLAFHLTEKIGTKKTTTGEHITQVRNFMEARVDGYLCLKSSPFRELNTDALAIVEAKRHVRSSGHAIIRRQEGAEMACWISQVGDSRTGLLRSSWDGRKRRLLISQDRHEIYIIVGEYGAGFEDHIRPGHNASKPRSSDMGNPAEADTSSAGSDSTPYRREPSLFAGSASYIKLLASRSIILEVPERKSGAGDSTQPEPDTVQSPGTRWDPEAGDFLIMNEFGPFLVTEASHMDLFIRRLIPLLLQLRGPRDGFTPEPLSAKFLHQPRLSTPDESSPRARRTLKRSLSWPSRYEQSTEDCERRSVKPKWGARKRQRTEI